jgi:hypothetical protein
LVETLFFCPFAGRVNTIAHSMFIGFCEAVQKVINDFGILTNEKFFVKFTCISRPERAV